MGKENIILSILFADIANSTRMYETLGNKAAKNLIGNCLFLLSKMAKRHKGTVVKTIGDEIMCTFPCADNAVDAAIDMHKNLACMPLDKGFGTYPPNIYVGIQQGNVIREDKDVFGDAVNIASRMASLAKQRQIITTEETFNVLRPELKAAGRLFDMTTIKGKSSKVNIYEIIWEQKDETVMLDETLGSLIVDASLELTVGDQKIEVSQNRPSITMGRQNHNDLMINDVRVSRTHARVEYRRGKFVLIDQSTNGTYVYIQGQEVKKLKRDEAPLSGNGVISLGRDMDKNSSGKVPIMHFELKLI